MEQYKNCYKCNENKLYAEFKKYPNNSDGYSWICKSCSNVYCQMLIDNGSKKFCSKCKIKKLYSEFYRQFGNFPSCCKTCHNNMNKANYLK